MTMQRSGGRNPCPCCGRLKTSHCAWSIDGTEDDMILCHAGERWGPPPGLSIGDVLDIDGRSWALTATGKGFAGRSHVFRPHRPGERQPMQLPAAVRRANAQLLAMQPLNAAPLEDQWAALQRDVRLVFDPARQQRPDRLDRLTAVMERCRHLLAALRRAMRSDPTLTPYAEHATGWLRQLRYEHQHVSRAASDDGYRLAWGDLAPTELEEEESDWAIWQQQKALPTHPWVIECRAAGEEFWYPVAGD